MELVYTHTHTHTHTHTRVYIRNGSCEDNMANGSLWLDLSGWWCQVESYLFICFKYFKIISKHKINGLGLYMSPDSRHLRMTVGVLLQAYQIIEIDVFLLITVMLPTMDCLKKIRRVSQSAMDL